MAYFLSITLQMFEYVFLFCLYIIKLFLFYGTCECLIALTKDMEMSLGMLHEEIENYQKRHGVAAIESHLRMKQELCGIIDFHIGIKELSEFLLSKNIITISKSWEDFFGSWVATYSAIAFPRTVGDNLVSIGPF